MNWKKCHSKKPNQAQNRYLNVLNDPIFQGIHWLFVLSFESDDGRKGYKEYHVSTVEIKDYNVVINGRNFLNQPIKNDLRT